MQCKNCAYWHQTDENEKDSGFCWWFENIETHKDDLCKEEEE